MKNYELLYVTKPNLDMEEVEKVITGVEETIKGLGGNVISTDKMGRKKLAYEVDKFKDGFFVDLVIEMPEQKLVELKRSLKLNDNVIREILLNQPAKIKAAV